MTRPLRVVKREIRILGLDFCNTRFATGAIVRGGQFLDGVLTFQNHRKLSDREIAGRILATRYFPELRAIMAHDPGNRSKTETIEKVTGLPVIRVSMIRPRKRGFRVHSRSQQGQLWIRTNLPAEIVKRIVSATWTFGRLPEPARIAHLLSRTVRAESGLASQKLVDIPPF